MQLTSDVQLMNEINTNRLSMHKIAHNLLLKNVINT